LSARRNPAAQNANLGDEKVALIKNYLLNTAGHDVYERIGKSSFSTMEECG